jgi:hypothetical protein
MNAMNPSVDEERIRVRAFELWQERGCPLGSPQDDWFAAKVSLEAPAEELPPIEVSSEEPADPRRLPLGLRFVTEQRSSSNDASSTPPPPSAKRAQKRRKGSRSADEAPRAPAKAAGARKSR